MGKILLLGSGETSSQGSSAIEEFIHEIPLPVHFALFESPAGFELNSEKVIHRVGDFLLKHLQNYLPIVEYIPKPGPIKIDLNTHINRILNSDVIFLGPGSPTYTVHVLQNSLEWEALCHSFLHGTRLILASAAVTAFGKLTLPVYEMYKVGKDPFWAPGLNFFKLFGLDLILIPHWNNHDGGKELDTSRCFIGKSRMEALIDSLAGSCTIVGIDEVVSI